MTTMQQTNVSNNGAQAPQQEGLQRCLQRQLVLKSRLDEEVR